MPEKLLIRPNWQLFLMAADGRAVRF